MNCNRCGAGMVEGPDGSWHCTNCPGHHNEPGTTGYAPEDDHAART